MITAQLTDLNYNEILMYLGHRGQDVSPEVDTQIRKCRDEIMKVSVPRLVYARMPVADSQICGFPMGGNDIREMLAPCREAVLLAATLGAKVEQVLMRREVTDMAEAVIMDACASAAIENVCDHFEETMRKEVGAESLYLTSRFSPGYGDLPLSLQSDMCRILNTSRRIGLSVTETSIMVPRKSVTAIMGIADTPRTLRTKGCEACNMFLTCRYRKRGITCE
ncbi:MAG: vitamin B12 dependent methionine synthase, activation domain protein [Clostridiales bacterium]|nr:vitamin B12 dependent methionine synthase, activation domain protein [Clostridiales bacterium]